jgi:hypothetical protein
MRSGTRPSAPRRADPPPLRLNRPLPRAPALGYTRRDAKAEIGMSETILERCAARGLRMTDQRRTVVAC